MKKLKYSLLCFGLLTVGELSAAVVTFDGLGEGAPLTTLDGWSTSQDNSMSHLIAWGEPKDSNMRGAFGGAYVPGFSTPVTLTMESTVYGASVGMSMEVLLLAGELGRDSFEVSLDTVAGGDLVSLVFFPAISGPDGVPVWELGYRIGDATAVTYTTIEVRENSWYNIEAAFTGSEYSLTFGNTLGTTTFASGAIDGFDSATSGLGDLEFSWVKAPGTDVEYGDNYILFDNINIVPEPSVALLSGVASLMLLRRRR